VTDRSGRGSARLTDLAQELEELRDGIASSRGSGPADGELETLGEEIEQIQAHLRRMAQRRTSEQPPAG